MVTCPCFLRLNIGSDKPTTWDIFLVPKQSYDAWKAANYSGDPGTVVEEFSERRVTTDGPLSFFRTEDTNAFIEGDYQLAIRTNTDEERCFSGASGGMGSSVVFESMPKACEIRSEEVVPRIVGGTPVSLENSPDTFGWMALVWRQDGRPVCGGAHVAAGYVVTAAHCEIGQAKERYRVKVGTLQAGAGEEVGISRVFTHAEYYQLGTNEAFNDIAVLELERAPERPTIAWNADDEVPGAGEVVTTAGFGYISEGWTALPAPNRLLRVDVPVVGRAACARRFENVDGRAGGVHLCAGYGEGGCDSCQADSGGPLRYVQTLDDGSRRQSLVGVVSFGAGCARSHNPGVYTRVSAFAGWLNGTIAEARRTRGGGGFLQNAAAVGGVGGAVGVAVVAAAAAVAVALRRRRGRSGQGEAGPADGSDVPSTSGISQ